jgi:hypothetical protein
VGELERLRVERRKKKENVKIRRSTVCISMYVETTNCALADAQCKLYVEK